MDRDNTRFSLNLDCELHIGEQRLAVELVGTPAGDALYCTVDMDIKVIPLEMTVEDFMHKVTRICGGWKSGNYFTPGFLDGYGLMFTVKENGQDIQIIGSNYFPENFRDLLTFLHEECHVPVSSIEKMLEDTFEL